MHVYIMYLFIFIHSFIYLFIYLLSEGRYGLVDKTHPSCVRPGLNTRVQH